MEIYNDYDDLVNNLIKINNNNPILASNSNYSLIPVSNKYYISILNLLDENVKNLNNYLNDNTRTLEYPFTKINNIDYSLMLEKEQFYQIDITNESIHNISEELNIFFTITQESSSDIILVLDIDYMIDNMVNSKNQNQPNHLFDFLLWKFKKFGLDNILILDLKNQIINKTNMLYIQLESCLKIYDKTKYDLNKNIVVYKKINDNDNDNDFDSVYWNLVYPDIEITDFYEKIQSPLDNTDFNIMKIQNKKCYVYNFNLNDHFDKNLMELNIDPGIIIEPIDRINIYV